MPQPQLLTEATSILRHYVDGGAVAGTIHNGSSVVIVRQWPHNDYWLVTDNGGEFNVEPINDRSAMRSVPTTAYGCDLNAATVAYRIATVMAGKDYDPTERMDDDETTMLLSLA